INDYFELCIPARKVDFRTIWFERNGKDLRQEFESKENLSLRALYWISKDFFDYGEDEPFYRESVEPEAEELNTIRNHLEHKYLKIHTFLMDVDKQPEYSPLRDELAYSITKNDFELKTLRLLQLARNALIYLSLSIHREELDRVHTRSGDGLIMPFPNDLWDDDWKV
ncbi:MAG: LA2681 family HEPN domain-containing protein, partial [Anaerolineae bacterium]|nr:LA2681 family HEPN domain-containing protein [Anaerolineae bacterium]